MERLGRKYLERWISQEHPIGAAKGEVRGSNWTQSGVHFFFPCVLLLLLWELSSPVSTVGLSLKGDSARNVVFEDL